jgi:hypothetical protein
MAAMSSDRAKKPLAAVSASKKGEVLVGETAIWCAFALLSTVPN